MTAQDALKQFVADELQPSLKARGFRSNGLTFYRQVESNFGLVHLQKSRGSTAAAIEFTINLGVFSDRVQRALSKIMWMPEVKGVPTEPDCHLRERVGLLMPEARDVWWSVPASADLSELGATIRSLLETHAFPFLDARISDEGLRDHWLKPAPRGPEGLALAALVRDLGPTELLAPLLDRLRSETPSTATLLIAAIEKFAASAAV